ncbi:hypothetical protein AMECASPLE_032739 [Ameca splendens]|uniref:Uncharacterized protein n=1 Tax=Ameca splendens TaxID=208324 RepID=A0ABV1AE80_9TELE
MLIWHTSCPLAKHQVEKKPNPTNCPTSVKAHADILNSSKAKRIVKKCGKCSVSVSSSADIHSAAQFLMRTGRYSTEMGVLIEEHWMVREVFLPQHLGEAIQLSQGASPAECSPSFSFREISHGAMLSSLVDLLG